MREGISSFVGAEQWSSRGDSAGLKGSVAKEKCVAGNCRNHHGHRAQLGGGRANDQCGHPPGLNRLGRHKRQRKNHAYTMHRKLQGAARRLLLSCVPL